MTQYYVASNGSDAANGLTTGTPWQTIAKVNGTTFAAGDTISFRGGDTFSDATLTPGQSGTSGHPITFNSYGTGRATIVAPATSDSIYLHNLSYITVDGFILDGSAHADTYAGVDLYWDVPGTYHGIIIQNVLASNFGWYGITSYCESGAVIDGLETGSCKCNANGAIGEGAGGIHVEAADYGTQVSGTYSVKNFYAHDCVCYDNAGNSSFTTNWSGGGILVGQCDVGLILNCVTYNNGANNGSTDVGGQGIGAYDSRAVIFRSCKSYGNKNGAASVDGNGFGIDGGCTNCGIDDCYSYGNDGAGFNAYCYADPGFITQCTGYIRWCISEGDALGTTIQGGLFTGSASGVTTAVDLYNNTVIAAAGSGACFGVYKGGTVTGNIANNIFDSVGGVKFIQTNATNPTGLSLRGNDYWNTGAFHILWNSVDYTTLASWQTATSQEKIAGSSVALAADPLFDSVSRQPSKLRTGSTMLGAGLNLTTLFSINPGTSDFFGNTISASTLSVGAYGGAGVARQKYTRLSADGYGARRAGDFNRTPVVPPAPAATVGGGGDAPRLKPKVKVKAKPKKAKKKTAAPKKRVEPLAIPLFDWELPPLVTKAKPDVGLPPDRIEYREPEEELLPPQVEAEEEPEFDLAPFPDEAPPREPTPPPVRLLGPPVEPLENPPPIGEGMQPPVVEPQRPLPSFMLPPDKLAALQRQMQDERDAQDIMALMDTTPDPDAQDIQDLQELLDIEQLLETA